MKDRPNTIERIRHIIEAIDRIQSFVDGMSVSDFYQNEMAQYAVIKNFEIIGEAGYKIPSEIRDENPQIEWRKIIAFRHILVHDYYKINMEIVWNAIENKLTGLRIELEELLDKY
ncbi:MAG: HepT-like ribonuclease domain-containing protein [Bacteroidia bacterium]